MQSALLNRLVILAVSAFFRELTRLDNTTGTACDAVICNIAAWLPGPAEQREPFPFSQAQFGNAVCTNAGRRATQVALTMHSGKVQYVSRAHGFLDWQIMGRASRVSSSRLLMWRAMWSCARGMK